MSKKERAREALGLLLVLVHMHGYYTWAMHATPGPSLFDAGNIHTHSHNIHSLKKEENRGPKLCASLYCAGVRVDDTFLSFDPYVYHSLDFVQ